MRINTRFSVGDVEYTIQADHEDVAKAFHEAIQATPRPVCDVCGSIGLEDKRIVSYVTKEGGFIYVKVICACEAESTMGKYRDGGIFWKPYEVNEYRSGASEQAPQDQSQPAPQEAPEQAPAQPESQPTTEQRRAHDTNPIGPEELQMLKDIAESLGWNDVELRQHIREWYSVERLTDLTLGQARGAYKRLKDELDEQVPF